MLWNWTEELRVPMLLFSDTFTPESLLRSGMENLDKCSWRLLPPSSELPAKRINHMSHFHVIWHYAILYQTVSFTSIYL